MSKFALNEIRDNKGARVHAKCIGRGIGSGKGKTSGRGGKGQTARSGVSLNGFAGGQTPLYRLMPKRGFKNPTRRRTYEIDFFKINRFVDKDSVKRIDIEYLVKNKYCKNGDYISLLSNGECKHPVEICVNHASAAAKSKLESCGGKLIVE